MAATQIIPTDLRQLWDSASNEVRSALAKEQFNAELEENSRILDEFIKENRDKYEIPLHGHVDLLDRISFGIGSINAALKSQSSFGKIKILAISAKRSDDGELDYTIEDDDGCVENNFITVHDDRTALIMLRILEKCLMHIVSETLGNYRDRVYVVTDEFKIDSSSASRKVKECMCLTAKILGIPVNVLPFEKGHAGEMMFGMIDLCFNGNETINFERGNWPLHGIREMAQWMYGSNDYSGDGLTKWSIKGNVNAIKFIITFEKASLAKRFWKQLNEEDKPKFLLLVTGGLPTFNYFIVRKFLYLAKKALSGETWTTHFSSGDCDPSSFMLQYQLETAISLSGYPDRHLLMPVRMIGPFPSDGK